MDASFEYRYNCLINGVNAAEHMLGIVWELNMDTKLLESANYLHGMLNDIKKYAGEITNMIQTLELKEGFRPDCTCVK